MDEAYKTRSSRLDLGDFLLFQRNTTSYRLCQAVGFLSRGIEMKKTKNRKHSRTANGKLPHPLTIGTYKSHTSIPHPTQTRFLLIFDFCSVLLKSGTAWGAGGSVFFGTWACAPTALGFRFKITRLAASCPCHLITVSQ